MNFFLVVLIVIFTTSLCLADGSPAMNRDENVYTIDNNTNHKSRISSGTIASVNIRRRIAIIRSMSPHGIYGVTCTATIISRQWLLSAAHCFLQPDRPNTPYPTKYFFANMGSAYVAPQREDKENYFFSEIFTHINYGTTSFPMDQINIMNDIALIKLHTPIADHEYPYLHPFDQYRIGGYPYPLERLIVSGYGDINEKNVPSTILQEAVLTVLSSTFPCNSFLSRAQISHMDWSRVICANSRTCRMYTWVLKPMLWRCLAHDENRY